MRVCANFNDNILTNCIHFLLSLPQYQSSTKRSNTYKTQPVRMPIVDKGTSQKDVISRLLQHRIILLEQGIDDEISNILVVQLLYLANEDPTKDIAFHINSPGSSVSAEA